MLFLTEGLSRDFGVLNPRFQQPDQPCSVHEPLEIITWCTQRYLIYFTQFYLKKSYFFRRSNKKIAQMQPFSISQFHYFRHISEYLEYGVAQNLMDTSSIIFSRSIYQVSKESLLMCKKKLPPRIGSYIENQNKFIYSIKQFWNGPEKNQWLYYNLNIDSLTLLNKCWMLTQNLFYIGFSQKNNSLSIFNFNVKHIPWNKKFHLLQKGSICIFKIHTCLNITKKAKHLCLNLRMVKRFLPISSKEIYIIL